MSLNESKIITFFLQLRNQIKLYHWQTKSYSRHKATDDLVGKLDEHIDKFVEVMLGINNTHGHINEKSVILKNYNDKDAIDILNEAIDILQGPISAMINEHTDLLNIRDEIIADLNQTKYLFRLNN